MKMLHYIFYLIFILAIFSPNPFVNASDFNNSESLDFTELFEEVLVKIKQEYIENIDTQTLIENAIDGMLSNLDPHSEYLKKKDFNEIQVQAKGEFGGIGVEIIKNLNFVKINAVEKNGPAYKVGIKKGDIVLQVNGQNLYNTALNEVVNKIRGPVGSEIKLKINRENKEINFTLRRELIKISSVKGRVINNIAYIKISSFTENTANSLKTYWKQLQSENNIKGILLDLRDNPGGLLSQAIAVCDSFLTEGQDIVLIRGRNSKNDKTYKAHKRDMFNGLPTVVLINNYSASASEIVAGALQDQNRAIIVGTRSFGKGSVQTIIPIKNGGAIRITNALYYTPSERSIQEHGIKPDIIINDVKTNENEVDNKKYEINLPKHIKAKAKEKLVISGEDNNLIANDIQLKCALDILRSIVLYKEKNSD